MTTGRAAVASRRLALFPGAFQPPHEAHLAAVLDLLGRPGVDEVVVIVSNRSRPFPGTTMTLDAEAVRRIWTILLDGVRGVRVEIAPHTAIAHAVGYFDRVDAGDELLFCVGEIDLEDGDDRFEELESLAERTHVAFAIVPAPTVSFPIRATALRELLALGSAGRERFIAALPGALTETRRGRVWAVCEAGRRDVADVIAAKVRSVLGETVLGEIGDLTCVNPGTVDPVFRTRLQDGRCVIVKYAGDTVETGVFGQALQRKPPRRILAERRALERLQTANADRIELPEVVHIDRTTRTLVLTDLGPGRRRLDGDLRSGHFSGAVAAAAGRFLAACHAPVAEARPLWGSHDADLAQWRRMLTLRTTDVALDPRASELASDLDRLRCVSDQATRRGLFHLDFRPQHILVGEHGIGIVDFEQSSTVGDPASDLGTLLGHLALHGLASGAGDSCQEALGAALAAYRQRAPRVWPDLASRAVAFAGASIVEGVTRGIADTRGRLLATGGALLRIGLSDSGNCEGALSDAALGRVVSGERRTRGFAPRLGR